jgi:hypothetical protein
MPRSEDYAKPTKTRRKGRVGRFLLERLFYLLGGRVGRRDGFGIENE